MEQAVSRSKKVKIIIAPTYDDSRAKITFWNDPGHGINCYTSHQRDHSIVAYTYIQKLFVVHDAMSNGTFHLWSCCEV